MRCGYFTFCLLLFAAPATAAILDASDYDASRLLPPPPAENSTRTKAELKELRGLAASSSAKRKAAATHDAKDESPDIFNSAIGFDIATAPQTQKLLQIVVDEEDQDTKAAKDFFHRLRPYSVDAALKPCEPKKPGKAANSYPSGHATLAFTMGIVLASMLPDKAQAILARASEYSENRLVCGVHYRSDIVAGQQFGTILGLRLMQKPAFQAQLAAAQAELKNR
ncbi:MAG TPA: phosphatase PAP2 family protein [Rhizomicrobium sp.]|nr:phosphatase PAP2 family protein [Rhizomicrobium sp.]